MVSKQIPHGISKEGFIGKSHHPRFFEQSRWITTQFVFQDQRQFITSFSYYQKALEEELRIHFHVFIELHACFIIQCDGFKDLSSYFICLVNIHFIICCCTGQNATETQIISEWIPALQTFQQLFCVLGVLYCSSCLFVLVTCVVGYRSEVLQGTINSSTGRYSQKADKPLNLSQSMPMH